MKISTKKIVKRKTTQTHRNDLIKGRSLCSVCMKCDAKYLFWLRRIRFNACTQTNNEIKEIQRKAILHVESSAYRIYRGKTRLC